MPRLTIEKPRERRTEVSYSRCFDYFADHPGWGFGFPCDEDGTVDRDELYPEGRENFDKCLTGIVDGSPVIDRGVRMATRTYTVPAIGRCVCGDAVTLDGDTQGEGIDCSCGRIYNSVGQELAPRDQWEPDPIDD